VRNYLGLGLVLLARRIPNKALATYICVHNTEIIMSQTITTIEAPLTFSESALEALQAIRQTEQLGANQYLRVGVKGGGCSGMSYVLAFDEVGEHDQHFQVAGIPMVMDKRHAIYLINMHVDYQDGLNARGFVFQNPNATSTCGCGTSFSA
jgi:iron-sulfur cluster assembly protein